MIKPGFPFRGAHSQNWGQGSSRPRASAIRSRSPRPPPDAARRIPTARILPSSVSGLICRPELSSSFQSPCTPMRRACLRSATRGGVQETCYSNSSTAGCPSAKPGKSCPAPTQGRGKQPAVPAADTTPPRHTNREWPKGEGAGPLSPRALRQRLRSSHQTRVGDSAGDRYSLKASRRPTILSSGCENPREGGLLGVRLRGCARRPEVRCIDAPPRPEVRDQFGCMFVPLVLCCFLAGVLSELNVTAMRKVSIRVKSNYWYLLR